MKTYLRRKVELAEIKKKLMEAENEAELLHFQKREKELTEVIKALDEQLTDFQKDGIGDELKNNLINLFERLKDEAKKHDSISKTEGQLDDLIFTKIDESVIDIVSRKYNNSKDLFMIGTYKYATGSILKKVLVDFYENEKSEMNKIQNPDYKSITEYYVTFHDRLMKLTEQELK